MGQPTFWVPDFGELGNDPSINTATLTASMEAGAGAIVELPAGEFLIEFVDIPGFAGFYSCCVASAHTTLRGQGEGSTILKLAPNQPDIEGSFNLFSNANLNGGDEYLSVEHLTFDGNGENQTLLMSGISFLRARFVKTESVTVRNVFGNAAFPPGETFGFVATACADVVQINCKALGTAGQQGTGMGSNKCTNVQRTDCLVDGMSDGMGYADWYSRGVLMGECVAQRCGANGFNAEYCEDYILNGGRAGGRASNAVGQYPWAVDESLGNTGSGVVINASTKAQLNGVVSRFNGNNGLSVVPTGSDNPEVAVNGGDYIENTNGQIYFGNVASARASRISATTKMGDTLPVIINGGGGNISVAGSIVAPVPTIPSSGVDVYNDFPFPVTVYIVGGTTTLVHVNEFNTGNGNRRVNLFPGDRIRVTYSVAPTWIWQRV